MNSQELDPTQKAAQAQFDSRSSRYGRSHILSDITDVEEAICGLAATPGACALDIATGGGHTAVCLARHGYSVTASDISSEMLKRTGELAASSGVSVRTRQHPAEQLPDPDNTFDLVTCRVAAHHFSDPPAFVREVARVLKPGGTFVLIDGSVPDNEPVAEAWIHDVEKLRDPSHHRFLTPGAWSALAAEAGLTVARCLLHPFKQPDVEWYFETAATSPANRSAVMELVRNAPDDSRRVFGLTEEDGKVVWWWTRLTLVATKPMA